ncbi:MAG: hypothetical protein AB8G17_00585 [Gammaproteobacteria bacterium]
MMRCRALVLSALFFAASSVSAKKLVLDPDNPEHWEEVRIGEVFATEVVADMSRIVLLPESYSWLRSGTYRRIGWRKDLKQIQRKENPKIRYGYFLSRTTSSVVYNGETREFEKTVDDQLMSMRAYFEHLGATDLTLTPLIIDDHDVLIVEGMINADAVYFVIIAENIGSSALQISFVCKENACRDPSRVAWEVFRESLLGTR